MRPDHGTGLSVTCPRCHGELPSSILLQSREWLEITYSKLSADEIAVMIGCNIKTVKRWLDRHEIQPHAKGRALRDSFSAYQQPRKDALIVDLRRWAMKHGGEPPTRREWTARRPSGADGPGSARRLFGSWTAALAAAGFSPRKSGERRYGALSTGPHMGANRQMVTGRGLNDFRPGTVKHFGQR